MPSAIEKDIFRAVVFFSHFGYPMTSFEIWKWRYRQAEGWSLAEVMRELQHSTWLNERLASQDGFYGVATEKFGNINEQVRERHARFKNAITKQRRLRLFLRYVARLPGVTGIAMCNSLVLHFTRAKSDIDLFIITRPQSVWSVRFFTVLPLMLLRLRPGEAKRDPIDTSFFVSEDALNLFPYKLPNDDPYLAWWTCALTPVFERENVFTFFSRHNAWAHTKFPNVRQPRLAMAARRNIGRSFPHLANFERLFAFIQRRKFPRNLTEVNDVPGSVVVTDKVLKFHKNDRRRTIRESFYETCAQENIEPFERMGA